MGRLIDEDDVISTIYKWKENLQTHKPFPSDIDSIGLVPMIKAIPTAQSDSLARPSARWMSVGHKMARICSHCFSDEPYKFADHDADIYDFCPHCGAKMEGE